MKMIDDNRGIAYSVSLTVFVLIVLGVSWISMSPVVDELQTVTDELHTQNPSMYDSTLTSKIDQLYLTWGHFLSITMVIALIYVVVTSNRKRIEGE